METGVMKDATTELSETSDSNTYFYQKALL